MASEYPPSPVPSDAFLWPGEKPFTAFGQFGHGSMDNRVFDQDIYWVNVHGEAFVLSAMSGTYRRNVIAFLIRDAAYFHANAALRSMVTAYTDALLGRVSGELLADELGVVRTIDLNPLEWLESTPLMRRLRSLDSAGAL